jgi:CHRD domain
MMPKGAIMRNRRLIASVASACTLGLVVGVASITFIGSAGAASGNRKYDTNLTGAQEAFPPGGDLDGVGQGQVKIKAKTGQVCILFKKIQNIGPATAAHIHQGPVGVDGPIVVVAATPVQKGKKYQKSAKLCTTVSPTLLSQLQNDPHAFYLNVHTTAFSGGAIRGQL